MLHTLGLARRGGHIKYYKYEKRGSRPGVVTLSANLITASGLISVQIKGAGRGPKPQCRAGIFNAIGATLRYNFRPFVVSDEFERLSLIRGCIPPRIASLLKFSDDERRIKRRITEEAMETEMKDNRRWRKFSEAEVMYTSQYRAIARV